MSNTPVGRPHWELQAMSALRANPLLAGRNLRIEQREGCVVLRGMVRSYYQKQMAQETLRQVVGERLIANELEVSGRLPDWR